MPCTRVCYAEVDDTRCSAADALAYQFGPIRDARGNTKVVGYQYADSPYGPWREHDDEERPARFVRAVVVAENPPAAPPQAQGPAPAPSAPEPRFAQILEDMAATARAKNREYGSNYAVMGPVMRALFPEGVPSELVLTTKWHLFELAVVKIARLAATHLTHVDSAHDMGIYGAMLQSELERERHEQNPGHR